MKNNFFLKYATLFCLLIFYSSCSTDDTELKFIEEINESELDQNLQIKNSQAGSMEVAVTYEFPPWITEEEQDEIKIQERAEFGQYFTIYSIVLGQKKPCHNTELWTVNKAEFEAHFPEPDPSQPNTSNTSNGAATITIVRRPTTGGGVAGGGVSGGGFDCFALGF